MSYARIEDALDRMQRSSAALAALPFRNTISFSRAVLEPSLLLDLIREAEPHELALFAQTANGGASAVVAEQLERLRLGRSVNAKWDLPKRTGPSRRSAPDHPSPLKKRAVDKDDPEQYIQAAAKLLSIYHLPRARVHVEQLMAEYEHVVDSIADLEAEAAIPAHDATGDLEAAIQREELEIIALQDAQADFHRRLKAATAPRIKRRPSQRSVKPMEPTPEPVQGVPAAEETAIAPSSDIPSPETSASAAQLPPPRTPTPPLEAVKEEEPAPAAPPLATADERDAIAALSWQRLAPALAAFTSDLAEDATPSCEQLIAHLDRLASNVAIASRDRADCALLSIILTALSSPAGAEPLHPVVLEPAVRTGAVPMFPMSTLKDALAKWARHAGGVDVDLLESLPTKAVYALVAKRLLACV